MAFLNRAALASGRLLRLSASGCRFPAVPSAAPRANRFGSGLGFNLSHRSLVDGDRFSDLSEHDSRPHKRRDVGDVLGSMLKEQRWSEHDLNGFEKNVFRPANSVHARSPEQVNGYREENSITIVHNKENSPNPILTFEEAGFPESVLLKLKNDGFERPTPIQAQGWSIALSGLDLIGIGQTGSGKTLGYVLPALAHLLACPKGRKKGPKALVLAPTRELAQQIAGVVNEFGRHLSMRSVCLYGGAGRGPQVRALHNGVDLVVATPGRLIDLLEAEATNLSQCTFVVLDEADRMLDMGFEPQIRAIIGQIRPDRQMLMWSATWPKEVEYLAEDFLSQSSEERRGHFVQLKIGSTELQANRNITQNIEVMENSEKRARLLELLRQISREGKDSQNSLKDDRILIFAQTKRTVDFIEMVLRREGFLASSTHGDKTQRQRDAVLANFRTGRTPILVATDVASRGLDVDDIMHVVNYDFPNSVEDYVHRIGRTGRRDKTGTSHTFLTTDDARLAEDVIRVLKDAGQPVSEGLQDLHDQSKYALKSKFKHVRSKYSAASADRFHLAQRSHRFHRYNRNFVRTSSGPFKDE